MRYFRRHQALNARLCAALTVGVALAGPGLADTARAQSAVDPNVKAEDIPMQPLRDFNVDGEGLPPLLLDIGNDPYSIEGIASCALVERAIADIDLLLGTDIDDPLERSRLQKGVNSAGRVAGSIVGGLIPFRGVVREISGAKGEERKLQLLINAAMARRGFLKGIGLAKQCPLPARPLLDPATATGSPDLPNFPPPVTDATPAARKEQTAND